jgi:hypothetical protein
MATFNYATKTGGMGTLDATDSASALKALSLRGDASPNSGISAVTPKPKTNTLTNKNFGGSTPEVSVGTLGATKQPKIAQYAGTESQRADSAANQALSIAQRDIEQQIDPNRIYQDKLREFQAEIDATNQIYAQMLSQQQEENRGTLGSARAIQARSGFLGSSFGQAEDANVNKQNTAQLDLIRAEQAAKINSILGLAKQSAAQEVAQKRQALKEGLQNYMQFLTTAQERRQSRLSQLASQLIDQGIDPAEIDANDLKKIAKEYGFSQDDIALGFNNEKAARANAKLEADRKLAQESAFTLSEGQRRMAINPATGEYEVVGYAPKAVDPSAFVPGMSEFTKEGFYAGTDPKFVGLNQKEVNSLRSARAGAKSTLQQYTDKAGVSLADKFDAGTLTADDIYNLSDADAASLVAYKKQSDAPGKETTVSPAEVRAALDSDSALGSVAQAIGATFTGKNYNKGDVLDVVNAINAKTKEEEIIQITN